MTNILITGATGFLGWNLVKELLENTDSKLYLLARGKMSESAKERVEGLIKKSYSDDKRLDILTRIEVIEGDITEEDLGIEKSELDKLHREIEKIYHCAALCEFRVSLERITKINVTGTENTLDFAIGCKEKGQFKSFHHISTVAVMGKFDGIFREDSLDGTHGFNNTYEETKFEAEQLVGEYRDRGLPISLYRPSIIVGDSVTGEVSNFQMLYQPLHIFSFEIFDEIPANRSLEYSLVPVDYVAKAIRMISSSENSNRNYHLTNSNTVTLDFVLDVAGSYFGFKKPEIVPRDEFDFEGLKGFRRMLLDIYIPYLNYKTMSFDATNFNQAVDGRTFTWPVIDKDLLLRLFRYCANVKYIKRCR